MEFLRELKAFLADRPESAFLALCILAIVVLWKTLRRSEEEKLELALRAIPVIDKMRQALQHLLEERRRLRKAVRNGESGRHVFQALAVDRKEGEGPP